MGRTHNLPHQQTPEKYIATIYGWEYFLKRYINASHLSLYYIDENSVCKRLQMVMVFKLLAAEVIVLWHAITKIIFI